MFFSDNIAIDFTGMWLKTVNPNNDFPVTSTNFLRFIQASIIDNSFDMTKMIFPVGTEELITFIQAADTYISTGLNKIWSTKTNSHMVDPVWWSEKD